MFDESVSGVCFVASLGGVQSSIAGKVVSEDINVFETTPVFGDGKCVDAESGARAVNEKVTTEGLYFITRRDAILLASGAGIDEIAHFSLRKSMAGEARV